MEFVFLIPRASTSNINLLYVLFSLKALTSMQPSGTNKNWLQCLQRPVVIASTTKTLIRAHKCQLREPIKMRDLPVINRRHSEDNWWLLMTVATDARNKPDPVALLMTAIFLNAQKLLALRGSEALRKLYYYHHGY